MNKKITCFTCTCMPKGEVAEENEEIEGIDEIDENNDTDVKKTPKRNVEVIYKTKQKTKPQSRRHILMPKRLFGKERDTKKIDHVSSF